MSQDNGMSKKRGTSDTPLERVGAVIVGAGEAGVGVAKALRVEGYSKPIILVGEESCEPYQRPPLSKSILLEGANLADIVLLTEMEAAALELQIKTGCRVVELGCEEHLVTCEDGSRYEYESVVLATGSRVRTIKAFPADLEGVHYLRTWRDAEALRRTMRTASRTLIIGGGWIGLEVAAAMRVSGIDVTLVDVSDRLCARAGTRAVSSFLHRLHRANGVDIRLGSSAGNPIREASGGYTVEIDGVPERFDAIVVGVGVVPNTELARAAGIAVENGILTDAEGRTSKRDVYACGDVANHLNRFVGKRVRFETWSHAGKQAAAVASIIAGKAAEYDDVPWFWSDEYESNLQVLGLPSDDDRVVVRGDVAGDAQTIFYVRDGRLAGVVAINSPRNIIASRKIMERGIRVDVNQLADTELDIRKLLKK
ncbi:MAG: pyridine nucleotide-disulfide oxidoreductase [Proteobacteria bacterium]|nr:MAG: pyridine nucleotide-disulfide oxidoreductase [Pseudomonadota bacterium]